MRHRRVSPAVHVFIALEDQLLRMAQVGIGQGALCVFFLYPVGYCIKYLFTGQRADVEEEAVGDLPHHEGQVQNLNSQLSHSDGVVVVIGDVQDIVCLGFSLWSP